MVDYPEAIKRIEELTYNTHVLFSEEGAKYYCEPLGLEPRLREYVADIRNPKGLRLNDGAKNAVGIASWDLAFQIYNQLHLEGAQDCFGRGSQQRAYCEVILDYLRAKNA